MDKIKLTSNNSNFLYCSIKGGVIYILLKNKIFKGIIREECKSSESVNKDVSKESCSNYAFQCTFSWLESRKISPKKSNLNNDGKVQDNIYEKNKTLNEISTHI